MDLRKITSGFKSILAPYYIVNIVLAVLYFILKTTKPLCSYMFHDCILELKEWEWITFLGCVIVLKNRKQASFKDYISTTCLFAKVLNVILFFKQNAIYGIFYGLICLLQFIFVPEPIYEGPENVVYFRGPHLQQEIERDKRVTWLICFYAAWSPACVKFAPVFSEISSEYNLENLKFGKLDVARYPDIGRKFNVDFSSWSKQLPSLVIFQEGKETNRKPYISAKGTVIRFTFTKENVIKEFDLLNVYNECKKNPLKSRKDKEKDKEKEKKEN